MPPELATKSHAKKVPHPIDPGGLSPTDHDRIFALAEKGWKSPRIAREIRKHPSTVGWFMYRNGLKAPQYGAKPRMRGGKLVSPFTPEEDALMVALRVQSYGPTKIADVLTKRFGRARSIHTVNCRLVMLAARDD